MPLSKVLGSGSARARCATAGSSSPAKSHSLPTERCHAIAGSCEPLRTGQSAQAIIAKLMTEEVRSLTVLRRRVPSVVDAAVRICGTCGVARDERDLSAVESGLLRGVNGE